MVPLLPPNRTPLGKVALIFHEVITPAPDSVGVSGKSLLSVLLVNSSTSGEYVSTGIWSTTVMFRYASAEPPLLLAQTLYAVVPHNSVGVPQNVPLFAPNDTPFGKVALISHVSISPAPDNCGSNGRSTLAVLFINCKSLGL